MQTRAKVHNAQLFNNKHSEISKMHKTILSNVGTWNNVKSSEKTIRNVIVCENKLDQKANKKTVQDKDFKVTKKKLQNV